VPTEADGNCLPELHAASRRLPAVRIHPLHTRTQDDLTGTALITSVERLGRTDHVFLCRPTAMVDDLTRDLRRRGIP
jgi:predicted ferric reductase